MHSGSPFLEDIKTSTSTPPRHLYSGSYDRTLKLSDLSPNTVGYVGHQAPDSVRMPSEHTRSHLTSYITLSPILPLTEHEQVHFRRNLQDILSISMPWMPLTSLYAGAVVRVLLRQADYLTAGRVTRERRNE